MWGVGSAGPEINEDTKDDYFPIQTLYFFDVVQPNHIFTVKFWLHNTISKVYNSDRIYSNRIKLCTYANFNMLFHVINYDY